MLKDICIDSKAIKSCSKCRITKNLNEYGIRRDSRDGYSGRCKMCIRKDNKEYKESNKIKIAAYNKKYIEDNKEIIKEKKRIYRINNREKRINR